MAAHVRRAVSHGRSSVSPDRSSVCCKPLSVRMAAHIHAALPRNNKSRSSLYATHPLLYALHCPNSRSYPRRTAPHGRTRPSTRHTTPPRCSSLVYTRFIPACLLALHIRLLCVCLVSMFSLGFAATASSCVLYLLALHHRSRWAVAAKLHPAFCVCSLKSSLTPEILVIIELQPPSPFIRSDAYIHVNI